MGLNPWLLDVAPVSAYLQIVWDTRKFKVCGLMVTCAEIESTTALSPTLILGAVTHQTV